MIAIEDGKSPEAERYSTASLTHSYRFVKSQTDQGAFHFGGKLALMGLRGVLNQHRRFRSVRRTPDSPQE